MRLNIEGIVLSFPLCKECVFLSVICVFEKNWDVLELSFIVKVLEAQGVELVMVFTLIQQFKSTDNGVRVRGPGDVSIHTDTHQNVEQPQQGPQ